MTNSDQNAVTTEAALDELKKKATKLEVPFHPNIGYEALKKRIETYIPPNPAPNEEELLEAVKVAATATPAVAEDPNAWRSMTPAQKRQHLIKEATKLVRVRVTCMNPDKKEWEGEVFTASNSIIPTQKKFVPFNAENGWHVPQIILNMIKERQCQVFKTVKGPRGEKIRKGVLVPEFSVEILDALTQNDLNDLAKTQAVANNLD